MILSLREKFKKNLQAWLITLSTGFALFFVLYIYKAYDIQQGLSYSGHGLFFRAISFGLLASLSFAFNEFYLIKKFKISDVKPQALWIAWEIFFTANLIFILFNIFWEWNELYWYGYFLLLFECFCVMIFPILAVKIVLKNKLSNQPNEWISFESDNKKHKIDLSPERLLYIKSADNYVEVFFESDGKVKRELVRGTLKNLEKQFEGSNCLVRCHRSYMVNPMKIHQVTTQKKQKQLDLGFSQIVPVSQKYQSNIQLTHSSLI